MGRTTCPSLLKKRSAIMYKIEKHYIKGNYQKGYIVKFAVIDMLSSKLVKSFTDYDDAEKYIIGLIGDHHE